MTGTGAVSQDGALRFDGRVALVTGAGGGLGLAYAQLLAERGASVLVNDLGIGLETPGGDPARAEEAAAGIRASGGTAVANADTVSTPAGAAAMVQGALDAFGRLDIIVNNAGTFGANGFPGTTWEELRDLLDVHVGGPFNVCRAAWPHLEQQRYGRIIVTVSGSIFGSARMPAYGAAKTGALGLARSLADAGREHGILVNALSPGALTPMAKGSRAGELADPEKAALWALKSPERVAPVVAALVHETSTISGRCYITTAGRVARVFLGVSAGVFTDPLPEAVAEQWAAIDDTADFTIPTDTASNNALVNQLILHHHAQTSTG